MTRKTEAPPEWTSPRQTIIASVSVIHQRQAAPVRIPVGGGRHGVRRQGRLEPRAVVRHLDDQLILEAPQADADVALVARRARRGGCPVDDGVRQGLPQGEVEAETVVVVKPDGQTGLHGRAPRLGYGLRVRRQP